MRDYRTISAPKVALTAALISLAVFIRAVFGDFVNYDDPRFVIDNPGIRTLDLNTVIAALTRQFSNDYWAPLTWISFAIDYHFWGLNPVGYHLVNLLLHAINTGLVVLLADSIWKHGGVLAGDSGTGQSGFSYPAALLMAGLLWGLHPLRVESVAWVAERKDVLYGMLTLCSVLCYVRDAGAVHAGGERGGRRYYLYSLIFFMLALTAKPTSVFLPMLLVVADWYPFDRLRKGTMVRALVEKVPYFALAALVTLLTVINMSKTTAPYSYNQFTFSERVIISGHSIFEFCRLMLVPVKIHLFNTIAPLFANPVPAYLQTALVAAFTGFASYYAVRKSPTVLAVWLFFVIPLLPTLAFFQVGADVTYSTRHSYMASVVPCITAAALLGLAHEKIAAGGKRHLRPLFFCIVAAVMVCYIGITQQLIGSWKNSGTLWSRVIQFNPIGRAFNYRALYFMEIGQFSAAADDFLAAAQGANEAGNPEAFNYYAYAGDAFNRSGRHEDAVNAFTTAIRLSPWPEYYYQRGLALKQLGRDNEAAEDFRRAGGSRGDIEFHKMW